MRRILQHDGFAGLLVIATKAGIGISVEDEKVVEFKLTLDQSNIPGGVKTYHGFVHEKKWKEMEEEIRRALEKAGLADERGKALF